MKKQFFAAAMILALGAGFTACSSDDLNVKEQKEAKSGKTATGYLTYTFSVATPGGTRASNGPTGAAAAAGAAATNDNQADGDGANPGYNFVEKWNGNDKVVKVTAYIFDGNTDAAQLEVKDEATDFTFVQKSTADANKTVIKPKHGVKVTVGQKTVYLVVNPTTDVNNLLDGIHNLGEFKAAYESANLAFASRTTIAANATTASDVKTAADALYTPGATAADPATIVMTGAPVTQTVVANIKEGATDAEDGTVDAAFGTTEKNRFNFTMKRAVATVFVTSKQATTFEYPVLKGDNPLTKDVRETNTTLASVSGLTFSQAQGELKLYFKQKAGADDSNTAYETPAYSFVSTADNYNNAATKYDYNGLWKSNNVQQVNKDNLVAGDGEAVVKSATVVPFLPATHQWTADGTNYKEGNTAYVLVRVTLKPIYVYVLQGEELVATAFNAATHNAKFFYGSDNKFYASKEAVEKAKESNASLKAKMFTNGKGLYTVWINPDTPTGKQWKNSPTNRNNIYHISINDIKSMPENWNPLVPGGVGNPDPKPKDTDNPNEPDPKHKPENPLSPVETWMSVDATILPLSIHSYGVEL